jgi:hypothetical protein
MFANMFIPFDVLVQSLLYYLEFVLICFNSEEICAFKEIMYKTRNKNTNEYSSQ